VKLPWSITIKNARKCLSSTGIQDSMAGSRRRRRTLTTIHHVAFSVCAGMPYCEAVAARTVNKEGSADLDDRVKAS
jgi:hypothetical protein